MRKVFHSLLNKKIYKCNAYVVLIIKRTTWLETLLGSHTQLLNVSCTHKRQLKLAML